MSKDDICECGHKREVHIGCQGTACNAGYILDLHRACPCNKFVLKGGKK